MILANDLCQPSVQGVLVAIYKRDKFCLIVPRHKERDHGGTGELLTVVNQRKQEKLELVTFLLCTS